MDDSIEVLQALPNLKYLALAWAYNGEKHFEGGFQKLKFLSLAGLSNLNEMLINEGALPLRKRLEMGPCKKLDKVPSGNQTLRYLKDLSSAGMANEFTQRLSRQESEIVRHIPILRYDATCDPNDEGSCGAFG